MRVAVSLAVAALLGMSLPAAADPVSDFYKLKGLTIYVGSDPGGGYDTYGRLVARQIGRFVPGNPNIVVKNLTGASGMRLADYMYVKAEKDGSEIGIVQNTIVLEPMM